MKNHHTTIVLAILFLTGLIVLWWADKTELDRVPSDAVLPALERLQLTDIKRLEVLHPSSAGGGDKKDQKKPQPPPRSSSNAATRGAGRWSSR